MKWQCYQKQENVRKLWPGQVILELTNMYPGVCPPEDLCLEMLWNKFEEFCKPQTNEVRARFDLLTSFRQGDMSVDEWYNTVQTQINLAKCPTETAKILHRDIFWFFFRDEGFVCKSINDSNIDLEKFPASKIRQLVRKLESSKSTARDIKKMSSDPQATQVNLWRHHRTGIPPNKAKRKQFKNTRTWGTQMKLTINKHHTRRKNLKTRKHLIPSRFFKVKADIRNGVIPNI